MSVDSSATRPDQNGRCHDALADPAPHRHAEPMPGQRMRRHRQQAADQGAPPAPLPAGAAGSAAASIALAADLAEPSAVFSMCVMPGAVWWSVPHASRRSPRCAPATVSHVGRSAPCGGRTAPDVHIAPAWLPCESTTAVTWKVTGSNGRQATVSRFSPGLGRRAVTGRHGARGTVVCPPKCAHGRTERPQAVYW